MRARTPLRLIAVALALAPLAAQAAPASFAEAVREEAGGELRRFYAARAYRPLWVKGDAVARHSKTLLAWLESARADGLDPDRYDAPALRRRIAEARDAESLAQAEIALSQAFVRYVQDQRRAGDVRMTWADRRLKPRRPDAATVLRAAAFAPSFPDYLAKMGWMSDHYVRLRGLMAAAQKAGADRGTIDRLRLNLDRARLLPGPSTRHIVVDASSGRLWYYERGRQVGTMRVVVGAKETQTPMLAGMLQWAVLNPYWNVPDYLIRDRIAPRVLGGRTLPAMGMEALSDWSADARRLDPEAVDWAAVAAGKRLVRVRELPGPENSMGRVKFTFPNKLGIYLHDTPERALLKAEDRHFSNGCIRLEDAATLGRWLMQRPLPAAKGSEHAVALRLPVPVYLTYLTATSSGGRVAFRDDVYGRDS